MGAKDNSRSKARRRYWKYNDKTEYECPDCGRNIRQLRNGFEVHHKDGDARNNNMANLVGLCRPCHNIREGKKPSVNDYRYLLRQNGVKNKDKIPLIKSVEQENENFRRCDESSIPVLEVIQKNRRKYCSVQIDFSSTGGWKRFGKVDSTKKRNGELEFSDTDHIKEPHAQLNERAVKTVNKIASEYRDKEQADHMSAFQTGYPFDFTRFPPLLPEVSREFAKRLQPVVMDRSNWEPVSPRVQEDYVPLY